MPESKYYDYTSNRPIDLQLDGCTLADWNRFHGQFCFAWHPKGFKVFLPPEKLLDSDEYAESDPYTVEESIDSDFHKRRIDLTIDLVREAISSCRGTPQVLDLGCGQGHITEAIRRSLSVADVTGLDYSLSAIEYAHEHFPKIDFAVGDVRECPYTSGVFDVVVCNNLWEHVPDPLFLLSRMKRAVKPRGHVIVSTPSRYRTDNLLRIMTGRAVVLMSPYHATEYTVGQVKEQLVYGGFAVRRVLSRPIRTKSIKARVAKWALSQLIALVGSHHQLEATVFFLAQETTDTPGRVAAPDGGSVAARRHQ